MIVCSKCGAQVLDGNRFCCKCGNSVDSSRQICSSCGKVIDPSSKFCSNCGNSINQATVSNTSHINSTKPIRPIICELCGSNSLTKENGFFVCQHCGTRYSLEEARKMMIEGTVQVAGTIKVDNSDRISNFLMMAGSAFEVKNYKEAEEYANKVIEVDSRNAEAWFIKGKAAGWQSTLGRIRLSESIQCWGNAIAYSGNNCLWFQKEISNEIAKLDSAIISLKVDNFAKLPTDFNSEGLMNACSILEINRNLQEKTQIPINEKSWREYIALNMNNAAVQGFETANDYFGTDAKDKLTYKYQTWLGYVDNCINILTVAMNLTETEATLTKCYNNAVQMEKCAINSKTYKFNGQAYVIDHSLTRQSILDRKKLIKELSLRRNQIIQRINSQK